MYLIYVDDSGDEKRTLFSALAIPDHRWSSNLKGWLNFRKQLHNQHGIPASYELHAQDWLSKTPEPLLDEHGHLIPVELLTPKSTEHRRLRSQLFESGLSVVGNFPDVRLLTVHTLGTDKLSLYGSLVDWIEDFLGAEQQYGAVVFDGLDQGHRFRRKHRQLEIKKRRLLEDPMECPSHGSQLIQLTDWCVHAAFRQIRASSTDDPKFQANYGNRLSKIIETGSTDPGSIRTVSLSA